MIPDICILFSYWEKSPEIAKHHFDLILSNNPGVPVVPLVHDVPASIPNTVDLKDDPNPWVTQQETADKWKQPDKAKMQWLWMFGDRALYYRYLRRPNAIVARRYVLLEWDTLAYRQSVREFYSDVWDTDCAVSGLVKYHPETVWAWWGDSPAHLPHDNIIGCPPFCGTMLSRDAVECLITAKPHDCLRYSHCELFTPTLLSLNGFKIVENRRTLDKLKTYGLVCGLEGLYRCNYEPGYYHPVTSITRDHAKAVK